MFKFCPNCKSENYIFENGNRYLCSDCDFEFFFDTTPAACAIIEVDDSLLLIERAKDPFKGGLSFPGGIVDQDESAEQALKREIKEELGLDIGGDINFLSSEPNDYEYKGFTYKMCDIAFITKLDKDIISKIVLQEDEVTNFKLVPISNLDVNDFCFKSHKVIFKKYLDQRK